MADRLESYAEVQAAEVLQVEVLIGWECRVTTTHVAALEQGARRQAAAGESLQEMMLQLRDNLDSLEQALAHLQGLKEPE